MEDKGHGFFDENGVYFLVRCHNCGRENYHAMVATGECAWCGSTKKPNKKKSNKYKNVEELDFGRKYNEK